MSNRVQNLRAKIAARSRELAIEPAHDSTGHWYRYKGQVYPSVTAKLSILKDQGLMNWKMNRALEYVEKNLLTAARQFLNNEREVAIIELLEQAKLAPQLEFEGAGDIGKATHDWRQGWFQTWIDNALEICPPPPVLDERAEVKAGCEAIKRCMADLKAQPLAVEVKLADILLKLGGTEDDLWAVPVDSKEPYLDFSLPEELRNGYKLKRTWQTWLIDLKTSNIGNKDSYYMQVATYWKMFRRLYKIKIDKLFILHTSKTRFGEYELIELKHPKRYWQMARSAYKLYDDLKELEELKKPEIAKI